MWRRAKRWASSPATVALLSAVVLLVSACSVEASGSRTDEQWRLPSHADAVAAASTSRVTGAVHSRPELAQPLVVIIPALERRVATEVLLTMKRGEGSLPPARQRYRRVVHDDRSDLPA